MKTGHTFFTVVALAGFTFFSEPGFAADWPAYRGPSLDGKTTETVSAGGAKGPALAWKKNTPNGFSSFVISKGRAFTITGPEIEGVKREALVAFDADTGKEIWTALLGVARYGHDGGNSGTKDNSGGDGPRSTPTIGGNRVYTLSSDLVLACFDLANGKKIWSKDIVREHKGHNISWKNAASPLIEGNLILVAGGGEGEALLGINKADGKVVWKGQDDKMTHATPVPATIHGVRQVIFFTQKGLVSVAPESGKVLWRHPYRFNVSTAASPVVENDIVYCSAGYGVGSTAVQISKNGNEFGVTELWRVTGDKIANHWSTPVVKDGYLYGMFQFKQYGDGPVKCVELRTGKEMWSKPGFGPGNVILAGDQLVALSDTGEVVLIKADPKAYVEAGRFKAVTGKCWSTPALANGRLYIRSTVEGAAFDAGSKLTKR